MIESRLDDATDGSGGGYGSYPGLTVAAIADRFRRIAEEGRPRSVRAVLRIVHEQTAARSALGVQRLLVAFGAISVGVLGILREFADPPTRERLTLYLGMALGVTALFGFGALSVERTHRRNAAQLREIRRLALLTLRTVVDAPGFKAKPLEREHRRAFKETRAADREAWAHVAAALGLL